MVACCSFVWRCRNVDAFVQSHSSSGPGIAHLRSSRANFIKCVRASSTCLRIHLTYKPALPLLPSATFTGMQQDEPSPAAEHINNSDIPKLRALAQEHNEVLACLQQLSDTHQSLQVARFHIRVFSDLIACRRKELAEMRVELQVDADKVKSTPSTLLAKLRNRATHPPPSPICADDGQVGADMEGEIEDKAGQLADVKSARDALLEYMKELEHRQRLMSIRTQGWQTRLFDVREAIFKQPSAFPEHDQHCLQLEIAAEGLVTADQAVRIAGQGHRLCTQATQMLVALYDKSQGGLNRRDKVVRALV